MDPQKAQLESTIRARRARLDRRLHRLENRIESVKQSVKHTGQKVGIVTGATVLALAMIGTIVLIVRSVRGRR
jgi:hypothetical protein